ncbi:MAG: agmatine deiminase family protein [Bacteroidota bacterium]|nr:agmatine deiminase family protein [Bacteroidota bacterium]
MNDNNVNKKNPIELGYKLLPEWAEHNATWIGWPQNKMDWPGKFAPIQWVYGEIVRKIAEGEKVRILVDSKEVERKALEVLKMVHTNISNVEFYHFKCNRGWTRDSGPVFLKRENETALAKFKFNAWAKYRNFHKDEKLPEFIQSKLDIKAFDVLYNNKQVVLEGGSIDYNGEGTLVTTEECLMDQSVQVRNSGFSKEDYLNVFSNYLGIKNIIWLGKGIAGDDTHGHVDDICRFVNKNTLVIAMEHNKNDANYKNLNDNKERLKDAVLSDGTRPEIIELPMPAALMFDGERLPASYANFYICNSAVLVPTFNDPNDRVALGILSDLFPGKAVCGIHAVDLVWGFGTLHCLTHEQAL